MNARLLLLAAWVALPAAAWEPGPPETRYEPDCTARLTLPLVAEPGGDPGRVRVEIAAPPTYRKLQKAYPAWVGSAQLEQIRQDGGHRVQIRSTEPLPAHPSTLVLVFGEGHEPPRFHTLDLPPCAPAGATREVAWGDTLLEIALERARALDVDATALMLAIQLYNREAFIHDNINLVRAGARLYIPSAAEIARLNLSRQWLVDEVRFQNEQWQNWRRQGTDPRESPTLQAQRLRLVPVDPMQPEPAQPEPADARPDASEEIPPAAPEPLATAPAEPEPAPAGPQPDETAPPPPVIEVERDVLAPLAEGAGGGELAQAAGSLPWPGILAAAGILFFTVLFAAFLGRVREAEMIRKSVGGIEDPARRATSALDLAHAHVEAKEYGKARPLIRLVLAEGTEQEREEAERLKHRVGRS